jgi:hypothetical protein
MDKKVAGLLGAAAALTTLTAAHAATPAQTTEPASYRDLLNPVANPVEALKADDARLAQKTEAAPNETQVAQVFYHHHHHHHHHVIIRPFRRHWRHHHHHHHHHHY